MPFYKIVRTDVVKDNDRLRGALGNYWYIEPSAFTDDGSILYAYLYENELSLKEVATTDDDADLRGYPTMHLEVDPGTSKFIHKLEVNPTLMTVINSNTSVPNFKIPIRLYADIDNTKGDKFWQTYFSGGAWGEEIYTPLIDSSRVYYQCAFTFTTYYSEKYRKTIDPTETGIFDIRSNYYDYNRYLQSYQNWASVNHERNLVNAYVIKDFVDWYQPMIADAEEDWTLTEFEQDEMAIQKEALYQYYLPYEDWYKTVPLERNQYYGESFLLAPKSENQLSAVSTYQENIMFDQWYYDPWVQSAGDAPEHSHVGRGSTSALEQVAVNKRLILPDVVTDTNEERLTDMFNISITFPRHRHTTAYERGGDWVWDLADPLAETEAWGYNSFTSLSDYGAETPLVTPKTWKNNIRDLIYHSEFSSKFLELLKDLDEGLIDSADIPFDNHDYATEFGGSTEPNRKISSVTLKSFDWLRFLSHAYNVHDSTLNENYVFIGKSRSEHKTTYSDNTLYRFSDNQNILLALDRSIDYLSDWMSPLTQELEEQDVRMLDDGTSSETTIRGILEELINPQYLPHGVLAYKIEKSAGTPTAGASSPEILQKFWMFNSPTAPHTMSLIDSQVKYGKEYTYQAYAYVSVLCYKYRYGDLKLTKQIGTVFDHDRNDFADAAPMTEKPDFYCLEFYDAETLERSDQLFTISSTGTKDPEGFVYSSLSEFNTWATSQQDISRWPQLADYNLYIEPCIKVIEVPLFSKTLKVLDSPPNSLSAIPFQFIDQSQRIGFDISGESFYQRTYPIGISSEDEQLRLDYLHSRCLLEAENITQWSESPARYIEIYKSSEKPTSFSSFDGKLASTIDLRIPHDNEFNFGNYVAADKISTNKKYYYLLRLLNENRMPGPLSPIIIAELVDDGGYIYSLFDELNSQEFIPDKYDESVETFKKLLQLSPTARHTALDSSGVDFTQPASSQLENLVVGLVDDKVWGKRFKIRLTSKKTGKKIDFNVKYNVAREDRTSISDELLPPTLEEES